MEKIADPLKFTGPIPPDGRHRAEELCRRQATQKKAEQVHLNTLSVSFVNSYLQYMGFETDLDKSDSLNPVQQTLMDVADLPLKNLGALECRPVFEDAQFIYIPPEVQSNRIGYVAVQIKKSFREATLLGFVRKVETDLLPIKHLQPLDNLLEYLEELTQVRQAELVSQLPTDNKTLVKLKQWLENVFEVGWQEVETLFDNQSANPDWNLRSANGSFVSRGKLIDLGKTETIQSVILVVGFIQENQQEIDIIVEVHPIWGENYLPPNLQLMVIDFEGVEGESIMEAQTRNTNKNIQLQFSGDVGERFSIKLVLGNISVIESFLI